MAPRGGKTRLKVNRTEQREIRTRRMPKRLRDGSDENGVGSDDVVATGSDAAVTTVLESSARVRGYDRPRSPRRARDGKLIATVYGGK
ncbi:hypothetical protein LIER_36988 [Lithospermum erythrorhizon]|uniref:Uncharacterized protein n=1 Tax=Lithospermum erythrorhizon TaxID=34254 RepID=A0AAV3PF75_LITER